jgi:hypothetical protein
MGSRSYEWSLEMAGPSSLLLSLEEVFDGLVDRLSWLMANDDEVSNEDWLASDGGPWPAARELAVPGPTQVARTAERAG